MVPASAPWNAFVRGFGYIPLNRMIRDGVLRDVTGVAVIVRLVRQLLPVKQ